MAFHAVYLPPEGKPEPLMRATFVRDGFSFGAFFFTGLWLLYKRMWAMFLLFIFVELVVGMAMGALAAPPAAMVYVQIAIALFLGFEGHALLGSKLVANGWRLADVVEGTNRDQAERRFFERVLEGGLEAPPPPASPPPTPPSGRMPAVGVIGVFPEAQGR